MNPTKPVFRKLYLVLLLSVFFLILIGATVRHYGAGVSCPDWPLCFGAFIPDFHPQVYLEFGHRAFAGLVSLLIVSLNMSLILYKGSTKTQRVLCWLSFVVLLSQIVMGGLTVLLNLHAHVVATHLSLGTGLFGILCFIFFSLTPVKEKYNGGPALKWLTCGMLILLFMQIILGGTVASSNAALVCPDWPLCHGSLVPTLSGTIGLQVMHRLMAYTLFILAIVFVVMTHKTKAPLAIRKQSRLFMVVVCLQIALGVTNVLAGIPVSVAVLHLAFATKLLYVLVKTNYLIRY